MAHTPENTPENFPAPALDPIAHEQELPGFVFRRAIAEQQQQQKQQQQQQQKPQLPAPEEQDHAYLPETIFHFSPTAPTPPPTTVVEALPGPIMTRFQQLASQFLTFPVCEEDPRACLHPNSQAIAAIHDLIEKSSREALTWDDFDRMEMALVRVTPTATLARQAWELRERYRTAVGPLQYALYEKSKPADWDDSAVPDAILRADMEQMLSEVQAARALRPIEDAARARMASAARAFGHQILWLCSGCIFAFVVTRVIPVDPEIAPALFLLTAMACGAVGGLVALIGRPEQKGAITTLLGRMMPKNDQISVYVAPIKGMVFAAVLYFLLAGNYLHGSLFPKVDAASLAAPDSFARLVVWSFAAGLATQLIPRTINIANAFRRPKNAGRASGK